MGLRHFVMVVSQSGSPSVRENLGRMKGRSMSQRSAASCGFPADRESGPKHEAGGDRPPLAIPLPGFAIMVAIVAVGFGITSARPARSPEARAVLGGHSGLVLGLAFSRDSQTVSACGSQGALAVWNTGSGRSEAILQGQAATGGRVALAPNGTALAIENRNSTVTLWNLPAGDGRIDLGAHCGPARALAFSRNGATLALADDAGIWLSDVATGRSCAGPALDSRGVLCLAFSADGGALATGYRDGWVRIWNLASGRQHFAFQAHGNPVLSLAFSDDANVLATGSPFDKVARLWDLARGVPLAELRGEAPVQSIVFAPGGMTVVTASQDGMARVWDVPTGRLRHTLTGHESPVTALAFSADGRTLATGSAESIRLWDTAAWSIPPPPG
jgi:WD40 repeat protein